MRHLERKQWTIIGLAGLIVAGFALLRFYPLIRRAGEISHIRRVQETNVARIRECAVQLPALRRQVESLKLETADYDRKIPQSRQFAELWQQIAEIMNRYSLGDQIVQPGPENVGGKVNCIPITIQCTGTLEQAFGFIAALRGLERAVRIEKCHLTNENDFSGRLKMNAVAMVFHQNSNDGRLGQ